MSCAKCKQCPPEGTDTWCVGCTAWEALGHELTARWSSAAVRSLANGQIVSAVKHIRALRSYSSSLQSAGDRRAAQGAREKSQPAATTRAPLPRSREGEHPQGSAEVKEPEESSEAEPDRSPIARRPEAAAKRAAEHSEQAGSQNKRKRKRNQDKRDRRGHRAGRNHQRLHRVLEDPSIRVHRRPPASQWDVADRLGEDSQARRSRRDGR